MAKKLNRSTKPENVESGVRIGLIHRPNRWPELADSLATPLVSDDLLNAIERETQALLLHS